MITTSTLSSTKILTAIIGRWTATLSLSLYSFAHSSINLDLVNIIAKQLLNKLNRTMWLEGVANGRGQEK